MSMALSLSLSTLVRSRYLISPISTKLTSRTTEIRAYHDYIRYATPGGVVRLPLSSPNVIGTSTSRGTRGHQEDHFAFANLSLNPDELRATIKKAHGVVWDPTLVDDAFQRQALFVGIYDGHGGSTVSQYLRLEFHGLLESVDKANIPELYAWIKELGGYFRRFKGGALAPWIKDPLNSAEYDLESRATQAFFEADRILSEDPATQTCGATASIAILHSLDVPVAPFFAAKSISLTIAHCGDTRVILCSTDGGKAFPMTENHHPDARVESTRLRRMMVSSLMTDSYGEQRWMGAVANTRCIGDLRYKKFGVTAEPQISTRLLKGSEWAFMVLVSDGVSSLVSDGEIVGLARSTPSPKRSADAILKYVEDLGGEDNMTAIVVPLAGWGKIQGPDRSEALREYRRQQAVGSERQRRM